MAFRVAWLLSQFSSNDRKHRTHASGSACTQTWNNSVDTYVALSEFARQKFVEAGLPSDKLRVKPNFVCPDPGERERPGDYAIFVGRLSPEKGVTTLLGGMGTSRVIDTSCDSRRRTLAASLEEQLRRRHYRRSIHWCSTDGPDP